MPSQCEQFQNELKSLKAIKEQFDLELERARNAQTLEETKKALQRANALKIELEQKRDALQEKVWPFENLPLKELKEQYESQKEILKRVGILEELSTGEIGIKAIDDKEYAFPEYQEIIRRIRENKEVLKTKTKQGFTKLLIVPFGMKLYDLIEKYKQVILKHHEEGKLLATKEKSSDPDEHLKLDLSEPISVEDEYKKDPDISGELVYFPKEFSKENHQGKTKKEILKEKGGFNILLIENLPNIPRQGKGKYIEGRKQLETGQTPNKYLETLKRDPVYQNETGMTLEEYIIYAISHLEQTNQVIDDEFGKGSASFLLGAFSTSSIESVPYTYWNRFTHQTSLTWRSPKHSDCTDGIRSAVRV